MGVPISGQYMGQVTGQVTCPADVSTGAARSEPHEGCGTAGPGTRTYTCCHAMCGGAGGVPGVQGTRHGAGARTTPGWMSAYTERLQG